MQTEDKVEYMAYPRMLAMSEVVWSGASENIDSDYSDFLARLEPFMDRLSALEINYANHLYEIEGSIIKKEGAVFYELKTPTDGKEIHYSTNDTELRKYDSLIPISANTSITANVFKNGTKVGRPFDQTILFHKGITASVSLNTEPHKAYSAGGKDALINGIQGNGSRYGDKEWLGFWGEDLEITIDFTEETEINMVTLRFYDANGQWIYSPKQVSITSKPIKGKSVSCMRVLKSKEGESIVDISIPFDSIKTTRLTISAPNYGLIPTGLQGAGNKAWTFIDEIIIE
jgi:hexosaminidase